MQAVDATYKPIGASKDLEQEFQGLKYSRIKGLNDIGKQKVYKEGIAEAQTTNVYIPETPVYEPTTVELVLYFVGDNRYTVYDNFNNYVKVGFHRYWDTARNRNFIFYIEDEIKIDEELWYGSTPYLKVTYKLQNVKGFSER